ARGGDPEERPGGVRLRSRCQHLGSQYHERTPPLEIPHFVVRLNGSMLDIAFIRQNPDLVRAAIKNKRFDLDLDELLAADKARREITATIDVRRARKNEIGALIPKASKEERPKLVEEGKQVRTDIEELEPKLAEAKKTFDDLMLPVPSIP